MNLSIEEKKKRLQELLTLLETVNDYNHDLRFTLGLCNLYVRLGYDDSKLHTDLPELYQRADSKRKNDYWWKPMNQWGRHQHNYAVNLRRQAILKTLEELK